MFGFIHRKNTVRFHSVIEETDAAWNECKALQKEFGWDERRFDEELQKRIDDNANAYVRDVYVRDILIES